MNVLLDIVEVKKEEIKKLHKNYSISRFRDSEFFGRHEFSFFDAIKKEDSISIIAEIKKASPSKGVLRNDFNHLKTAGIYFENEVDAISVLTDTVFFQGSIDYLYDIAKIKNAPLLRKDFIMDEFQVYEAKSNGADAILLISEILSKNQIMELTLCARENDMDVLLELHSKEEINKIDFLINNIIGINNRNLKTFDVNLATTGEIAAILPKGLVTISESGINCRKDFDLLIENGINGALIGEFIITSPDIRDTIKEIKEWSRIES